jgi:hypothetical protein
MYCNPKYFGYFTSSSYKQWSCKYLPVTQVLTVHLLFSLRFYRHNCLRQEMISFSWSEIFCVRLEAFTANKCDTIFLGLLALLKRWKIRKALPVTGLGGLQGCETSKLPHFLDNRLTDGVEVVSLTHRPPEEDSWYSFLLEAESTPRP